MAKWTRLMVPLLIGLTQTAHAQQPRTVIWTCETCPEGQRRGTAVITFDEDPNTPPDPSDPHPDPPAPPPRPPPPSPPVPDPPDGEGPHDYFEALRERPELFPIIPCENSGCSLRDQAQLDLMVSRPDRTPKGPSTWWTYDPAADTYHFPQDGAKLVMVPHVASVPGGQMLRARIDAAEGPITIIWDAWYGPEFRTPACGGNIGGENSLKTYQVRAGDRGSGHIWFETRNRWLRGFDCTDVGTVDNRVYGQTARQPGPSWPPGVTRASPFSPTGERAQAPSSYAIKHSTWTRYLVHIDQEVDGADPLFAGWRTTVLDGGSLDGTWHALSLWVCDETRECTRILSHVPWLTIIRGEEWDPVEFQFEFNTSRPGGTRTGNWVAYARNLVVLELEPDESDRALFRRPVR